MIVHRVEKGIALINEGNLPFGEVRDLEWENYEELVYPCLQLAVAAFSGGPGLGCDVIEDAYAIIVAEAGYLHIEAGIIDENNYIWLPFQDVCFAVAQVSGDLTKAFEDIVKPHNCSGGVVAHFDAANGFHEASAPEAKLRLWIFCNQALHQVAAVKVARCFARYEVVLHYLSNPRPRRRSISTKSVLSRFCGVMVIYPWLNSI